jgi:hypothetical protein
MLITVDVSIVDEKARILFKELHVEVDGYLDDFRTAYSLLLNERFKEDPNLKLMVNDGWRFIAFSANGVTINDGEDITRIAAEDLWVCKLLDRILAGTCRSFQVENCTVTMASLEYYEED